MNLQTLERLCNSGHDFKLFIVDLDPGTHEFFTGYPRNFKNDGDNVLVDLEPCVWLSPHDKLRSTTEYRGLRLYAIDNITRGFKTHEREVNRIVAGRPDYSNIELQNYLRLAKKLK